MADDMGAQFRRQRLDALLQRIALIGEGEFGAVVVGSLGDAPGDRSVVRDAQTRPRLPFIKPPASIMPIFPSSYVWRRASYRTRSIALQGEARRRPSH
jgi:hypothetical protein